MRHRAMREPDANRWAVPGGEVSLEDGAYRFHPADSPYLPPIPLPLNAAILCQLPNEAIRAGGAQVPMREPGPRCASCGAWRELAENYTTEPCCFPCLFMARDAGAMVETAPRVRSRPGAYRLAR